MHVQLLVPHLTRALPLALALVAGVCTATPALAAEPCIQFNISAVTLSDKMTFAPGDSKFALMRRMMEPKLRRIQNQAAEVFRENNLLVAFDCPRGKTAIIGKAEGVIEADGESGDRFLGRFYFVGTPWNRRLENEWDLLFYIGDRECDMSDELIAVSNALVDHRRSRQAAISSQTLGALQAYLQRRCGIRGSASFRQLKSRLDLLRNS